MDEPTLALPDGPDRSRTFRPLHWGPFRLEQKIGEGAFGEVYRAWDPTLEREVALKLLLAPGKNPEASYQTMLREARLAARVRHPNIVSVYGADRHDGRVGFWTDFVRGRTLSDLLKVQGRFSPTEAALIGIEVCRAVSAVHAAGLLHRDIKLGNIMREDGGRILLMDFGLSHEAGSHTAQAGGTPHYMAPEILTGGEPSRASDVYAIGVVLYRLATGQYPQNDHRPDLPEAFLAILDKALHPDPSQRYPGAGELRTALSQSLGAAAVPEPARVPAPVRRRKWWLALIPVLVAAGTYPLWRGRAPSVASLDPEAEKLLVRYDQPKNLERAIDLYRAATRTAPGDALAWAGLGRASWRLYLNTTDPKLSDQALAACGQAVKLNPRLAPGQMCLGAVHVATGQQDLGMQELLEAERLSPRSPEIQVALADAYHRLGRDTEAEGAFQKAADLDPGDWRWAFFLGRFYIEKGRYQDAEKQNLIAQRLSPDNARVALSLGVIYFRQGRYPDARRWFEEAIRIAPDSASLSGLGSVHVLQGDYQAAAAAYLRATDLNKNSYTLWGNLAAAYQWSPGGQEKAREAARRAADLAEAERARTPRNARLLVNLGGYYALLALPEKSVPLLRQAIALDPDNPDIVYRAGESYEVLGMREDALKWITKALSLGFAPEYVKRSPELARLRQDKKSPPAIRDSR